MKKYLKYDPKSVQPPSMRSHTVKTVNVNASFHKRNNETIFFALTVVNIVEKNFDGISI